MAHPSNQPPPSGPRRRDARGTRDRLVRAALELFTAQGYHASTTPQIAQRAGVAEGTIYRHFKSKEQLLNEIYRGAVRLFGRFVRESPTHQPCRERLAQIALAWREIAGRDPAVVRLAFLSRLASLLDDKSRDARRELSEDLERVIASGKAAGDVRAGAVDIWAEVWLRLVTMMLERVANKEWAGDHGGPRLVIEGAWDAIRTQREASAAPPPAPPPADTSA